MGWTPIKTSTMTSTTDNSDIPCHESIREILKLIRYQWHANAVPGLQQAQKPIDSKGSALNRSFLDVLVRTARIQIARLKTENSVHVLSRQLKLTCQENLAWPPAATPKNSHKKNKNQ